MDADGIIWVCDDNEWLATAWRGRRAQLGVFMLASELTPARRPRRVCEYPEAWTRDIVDGDAEGFVAGFLTGGLWGGVGWAGGGSGYRAWKYNIKWAICSFF